MPRPFTVTGFQHKLRKRVDSGVQPEEHVEDLREQKRAASGEGVLVERERQPGSPRRTARSLSLIHIYTPRQRVRPRRALRYFSMKGKDRRGSFFKKAPSPNPSRKNFDSWGGRATGVRSGQGKNFLSYVQAFSRCSSNDVYKRQGEVGANKWDVSSIIPFLKELPPTLGVLCSYLAGVVTNLLLTPFAATVAFTPAFGELGVQMGVNPLPLFYAFEYGLDQYFFCLLYTSYGRSSTTRSAIFPCLTP